MATAIDGKNGEAKDDADRLTYLVLVYMSVKTPVLIKLAKPILINYRQDFLALSCYGSQQFERFREAFLWAQPKHRLRL
ncbi:MAG: hypothetical protein IJK42_06055 [Prevotella sp.]|nr:hypothetical protein [Prevotella sp.]